MQTNTLPPHSKLTIMSALRTPKPPQRGIVILVVMVIVLITSLLVLWAARNSLLNERITGNDADYQRAFEAAEMMLRDAEHDILNIDYAGEKIADCNNKKTDSCRPEKLPSLLSFEDDPKIYLPSNASLGDDDGGDLVIIQQGIKENTTGGASCLAAICIDDVTRLDDKDGVTSKPFWQNTNLLAAMKNKAAYYGEYTGANKSGHPLLRKEKAWYWIEPLLYTTIQNTNPACSFAPHGIDHCDSAGFIFRITVLVEGNLPGTKVILQSHNVQQVP